VRSRHRAGLIGPDPHSKGTASLLAPYARSALALGYPPHAVPWLVETLAILVANYHRCADLPHIGQLPESGAPR